MRADDPDAFDVMQRCMVARIATLSGSGRPSITPLYFVCQGSLVWLGTSSWTLAARDAGADPRVSLLFTVERAPHDRRILRVTGRATVRMDASAIRAYNLRVVVKYSLSPGGLINNLANLRLIPFMNRYHAQSKDKGQPCIIEVTPERAEFLDDALQSSR